MQIVKKSFKKAGLCLAAVLMAGSAHAGIIFSAGVAPSATAVENVRFDPTRTGVVLGPSNTVTGIAGRTSYLVDFSSNEFLIAFESPPPPTTVPPTVRATDGTLRALEIGVRNGAFTTFFYNLRIGAPAGEPTERFANVLVTSFDGSTTSYLQQLQTGFNLLTITVDDATLLRGIAISSATDILDLRQARVGGLQAQPIPEPAILMSFSLAGLALWSVHARRRGVRRICTFRQQA